jgi:SAM-dependent methyltransferase
MINSLKSAIKLVACIESSAELWQPLAVNRYRRRIEADDSYRTWLVKNRHWIKDHYGHYREKDEFILAHLSSQLYGLTEKLRERVGLVGEKAVLDAGASDGMFLSLLGVRNGVGINILKPCVEKIRSDGYAAMQCNIEDLPFEDNKFDAVICTETIEHTLNPLRALGELKRVCRGKIYMTIPWLPKTRINAKSEHWPEVESHVYEFSVSDFKKIVTFSDLHIVHEDFVQVFPEPKNPLWAWWFRKWMYGNFFPKLQYYELEGR